jgi:hypothetical protein
MKRYIHILLFCLMSFAAAELRAQTPPAGVLTDAELRGKPYFTSLEEALKTPDNVYKIAIDATGLRRLPQEIKKLPNLHAVAIFGDKKSLDWELVVTDLQSLPKLKGLAIDGAGMEEIPYPIFRLVRLSTFEFNNAPITALPVGLFKLKNLTTLVITDTEVAMVPDQIGQLTKLEYLYLKRNKLERLPGSMVRLTNLKSLSIDSNYITSVPSAFKTMGKLESLSLSGNKLSEDELKSVKYNLGDKVQGNTGQVPKEEVIEDEEGKPVEDGKPTEVKAPVTPEKPVEEKPNTDEGQAPN